jgi:hypothetical protein
MSALMACAISGASFGETVTMSLLSAPNPGLTSSLTVTAKVGTTTTTVTSAGAFKWNVTGDTGSTFSNNVINQVPLYTFCIQAFQTTGTSYTVANLNAGNPQGGTDAGVIDALAAAQIQGLVDKYWSALDFTKTNGTAYVFNSIAYTDDQVAAAFQLAVWEIEYDGGTGGETYTVGGSTNFFTGGNLKAVKAGTTTQQNNGQAAINLANGWLNKFTADTTISSLALVSGYKQDQLVGIPNSGGGASVPTPLPAALPGGAALIGGLGFYKKLRKRKAQ